MCETGYAEEIEDEMTMLPEEENVKEPQEIILEDLKKIYGDADFYLEPDLAVGDGAFSFASENEEVAQIDAQGQVTIVSVGKAVLRVTASETADYAETVKEITLTVKTSFDKPIVHTVKVQDGSIKVKWDAISGADGYYIYRKKSSGNWEKKETVAGADFFIDTDVVGGKKYSYRIKAYADEGKNISSYSAAVSARYLECTALSLAAADGGLRVSWDKVTGADGYYIYRKAPGQSAFQKVKTIASGAVLNWKDTSLSNGILYEYTVKSYNELSKSASASGKKKLYLKTPSMKQMKRLSPRRIKVFWEKNSAADGYQIQYSTSAIFAGKKTCTVTNREITAKELGKLAKNKVYYVRVRAYRVYNGKKYVSTWSAYKNISGTKTAFIVSLKKGNGIFELRKQAKQKVYQYDTMQGGCSDGTYGYYMLYNRRLEKCKIAKVKLSSRKVVKVSAPLKVAHGNDMTYNADTKKLLVVHNTENPKRISIVNPKTLKVEMYQDIKIPEKVAGASKKETSAISGFGGIAYNSSKKCYVLLLSKTANLLLLDENLQPISYLKPSKKNNYTYQGIDATNDYILVGQSPKNGLISNIISVYTWEGDYVSKIHVRKGYELEHIYHVGNQFYAGFYRSYYKTYYTKEKKKVVINGKKKKVTVKVRHRKLMRDNYIYKIENL